MTTNTDTTSTDYKTRENKARRAADRQGLRLEKSRARDPRDLTYGTYQLVDQSYGGLVHTDCTAGRGYGLNLDDVETYLNTQLVEG